MLVVLTELKEISSGSHNLLRQTLTGLYPVQTSLTFMCLFAKTKNKKQQQVFVVCLHC